MLTQADLMPESLIAQFAGERSFPVMRSSSMHLEAVRRRKHLLAFYTTIHVPERHHSGPHQQVMVMGVDVPGGPHEVVAQSEELVRRGGLVVLLRAVLGGVRLHGRRRRRLDGAEVEGSRVGEEVALLAVLRGVDARGEEAGVDELAGEEVGGVVLSGLHVGVAEEVGERDVGVEEGSGN